MLARLFAILPILLLVAFMRPALAQSSSSDTATATINVLELIAVTTAQDGVFGDFATNENGGDVDLGCDGTISFNNAGTLNGPAPQQIIFDVTGDDTNQYNFTAEITDAGTDHPEVSFSAIKAFVSAFQAAGAPCDISPDSPGALTITDNGPHTLDSSVHIGLTADIPPGPLSPGVATATVTLTANEL